MSKPHYFFNVLRNYLLYFRAKVRKLPFVANIRRRLALNDANVVIVSFPKSGRTWLKYMIGRALQFEFGVPDERILSLRHWGLYNEQIPTIYSTHDDFPHNKFPNKISSNKKKYTSKKVVLLVRDPRDVMVSMFFQKSLRRQGRRMFKGNIKDFIYEKKGGIESQINFLNVWADMQNIPEGFHLLTYEGLKANPNGELTRLLKFIGLSSISKEAIENAVAFGAFDKMKIVEKTKAISHHSLGNNRTNSEEGLKVRKGEVGGYKNYLGDNEIRFMDEMIKEKLSDFYFYYK